MLASLHHKEGLVSQKTFEKQTIPEFVNPYFDDCPELLISISCYSADIATAQHQQYCQDVIWTGQNQPSRKTPFHSRLQISQQLTVQ